MNILTFLRNRGLTLSLAGDSLKFKSAQGITPEQKELLRKNKAEIMRLLREEQNPAEERSASVKKNDDAPTMPQMASPAVKSIASFFPSRCIDCSRHSAGCTRDELAQWGLASLHNCSEYHQAPPPAPPLADPHVVLAPLVERMTREQWAGGCARCSHFGPSHSNPLRSPGVCMAAKTIAAALPYPTDGRDCEGFLQRTTDEGKEAAR